MTDESSALVPIQERSVDFYGDRVLAVLVQIEDREEVYVPVRPIAHYLGLDWPGQFKRLKRDRVLAESLRSVAIMSTDAGEREMLCMPLKYLPGWLFGVTTTKVRAELVDKIDRYRRECFDVLWRAFQGEALARQTQPATAADTAILIQVRETALAVAALADQQLALQGQHAALSERLDRAAEIVRNLTGRVAVVERRIGIGGGVTEEQATEISMRVKALAERLGQVDPSRNHYQSVFAELYRRFGVSSYKSIPLQQFEAVMAFLDDWWRSMGDA